MKVLFLMSHAGHARNFESTLTGLAERGHEVHMAFDRQEKRNLPGVAELADALVAEYPGITSGTHPKPPKGDWGWVSSRLRLSLDYMRYLGPEFENAPKLRARAEKFAPPRVRRFAEGLSAPGRRALRRGLRAAERAAPISQPVTAYLQDQAPDLVLVTPLLEPGSIQVEYLRAANQLGIPTCLCVASWDNLTNKGLVHEQPDGVTVWNEAQLAEAVELHGVSAERVHITGAVAYDHWFGWRPSRSREAFASDVGIDPTRPFVLYVGSSGFIAPDEAEFVAEWIGGLRGAGLDDIQVLVRPHPVNPMAGSGALDAFSGLTLYPRAGANPTSLRLRQDYYDSLYYSSAVVGVNTSAFLEAAILGRPVFTVAVARYADTQEGMLHFRHLLSAGGGLLHLSDGYPEHAAQLRHALAARHPEQAVSDRSRQFTAEFIRPYGLDQAATPRMIEAIEAIGKSEKEPQGRSGSISGRVLAGVARRAIARERRRQLRDKHRRDQANKPPKAPKRPKPPKPPKAEKAPKPPKAEKAPKPPKAEKPPKPPKAEKAPKVAKSSRPSQGGKPTRKTGWRRSRRSR